MNWARQMTVSSAVDDRCDAAHVALPRGLKSLTRPFIARQEW
jgi:hypothetical protein